MGENLNNLTWNKKIHVLRIAKGWTQKEAAEKCGTNQQTYQLWESGKSAPRLISKKAIAAAFKVNETDIFSSEGEAS